jgi:hypothetical protein
MHSLVPRSACKIHFPILKNIPVSESKQAFAFANYNIVGYYYEQACQEIHNMKQLPDKQSNKLHEPVPKFRSQLQT